MQSDVAPLKPPKRMTLKRATRKAPAFEIDVATLPQEIDAEGLSSIARRMAPAILQSFYVMALDENQPGAVRHACGESILNRAYGRPQQQVAVSAVTMDVTQLHLEALRQLSAPVAVPDVINAEPLSLTDNVSDGLLALTEPVRDALAEQLEAMAPQSESKSLILQEEGGTGQPPSGDHLGGAAAYATPHAPDLHIGRQLHDIAEQNEGLDEG